ncbi:MAG: ABC transporter ATP-binding protein [Bacilli bacterium]
MNSTFRRMVKGIVKYQKLFIIGVILVFLSGVVDLLPPRFQSWAIDNLIVKQNMELFPYFIILYAFIVVIIGTLTFVWIRIIGSLELSFSRDLRNRVFKKVQELHLQYFNDNDDGWIIARMTSDISKLSEVMSWQFVDSFYFILIIILSIISIISYSIKAGVVVVIMYPLIIFVLFIIKTFVLKQFRKVRAQNSVIVSKFNEFISGILTIKTMAIEEKNFEEFKIESNRLRRYSKTQIILSGLFGPTIIIMGYAMFGAIVGFSVDSFVVGNLTIGEVSAIMSYTYILLEVTTEITNILSQLQNAQANAERVYGLLDTEIEIDDYNSNANNVVKSIDLKGDIVFKDVCFKYKNGEIIFDHLNITLEKGKSVALVGSTGSGKTTMVNLISRFYEVQSGTLSINNHDVKTLKNNLLHKNIGHVLQHPFLFNGSVMDNIKYNSDVSNEQVFKICDDLGITNVFDKLERGLNTKVGEGGSKLSVGEKQLISFARALINNPQIIILDEATSSIDYESEELIQQVIYKMMKNRTMIIIAHRLSTIEQCDRILYLKSGKIIEQGTHRELIDLKGSYYNLVNSINLN